MNGRPRPGLRTLRSAPKDLSCHGGGHKNHTGAAEVYVFHLPIVRGLVPESEFGSELQEDAKWSRPVRRTIAPRRPSRVVRDLA